MVCVESSGIQECVEEPVDSEASKLKPCQDETVEFVPAKKEPCKKASLVRAMFYVFWGRFVLSGLIKLAQDIVVFIQPYLLQ